MARRRQGAPAPLEKAIQQAVCDHWGLLGLPDTLVAAIPSAGALGQPGLTKGLADLLVLSPSLPGGVGFLELKTRSGKLSDAQRNFAALCVKLGIPCMVAVGRDEPIALLEQWGVIRRAAA